MKYYHVQHLGYSLEREDEYVADDLYNSRKHYSFSGTLLWEYSGNTYRKFNYEYVKENMLAHMYKEVREISKSEFDLVLYVK